MLDAVKLFQSKRLISFDIFDTILFRTCAKPTDIYYQVGFQALQQGSLPEGWTAKRFQQVRILAETAARKNKKKTCNHDEVTLEEIYRSMPKNKTNWERFIDLEIEVEHRFCYLNPDIMKFIKTVHILHIPIVLVSDMYLAEKHIRRILQALRFPLSWVDRIIVSNEYGVGKSSGKLFNKLFEVYPNIERSHILHVGDSRTADVEGAKLAGIQAYHYNVIPEQEETIFSLEDIYCGEVLPELRSLRKLAVEKGRGHELAEYFQLGAGVLGPFLAAFCEWLITICEQEKKSNVIAFMREGTLFKSLLEKCAKRRGVNIEVSLLYVSRHATDLAGIKCVDEAALQKFFSWRDVTIESLLDYLELSHFEHSFQPYYTCLLTECESIAWDEQISLKKALIEWLLASEQQIHINNLLADKRGMLISYVKQVIGDGVDGITVDLGFKGTIQRSLEDALYWNGEESNLTHLMAFGCKENAPHLLNNIDIRTFIGLCGADSEVVSPIMRSPDVLEVQILATEGSTKGYIYNPSGQVLPIISEVLQTPEQVKAVQAIQEGVHAFQQLWLDLTDSKAWLKELSITQAKQFGQLIARQINLPTLEEARLLGDLQYENNRWAFWRGPICGAEDEKLLIETGKERFWKRACLGYQANGVLWPQGVLTRRYPHFLVEQYALTNHSQSHWLLLRHLVEVAENQGYKQVIVYGAGDIGRMLVKVAQGQGLTVECVVDQKEALWGQRVNEVEIMSLDKALSMDCMVFLIGSFAFTSEIASNIRNRCRELGMEPIIINV